MTGVGDELEVLGVGREGGWAGCGSMQAQESKDRTHSKS